jgi:quinol monooxygenase YgiN
MAKPSILAKLTCLEGKREEVISAFGPMFDHVRANEPGTLVYVLHKDDADADVLWFYELYSDDDAVATHGASDTMKAVGKGLRDLMAGRPEIRMLTPVTGKGLDL